MCLRGFEPQPHERAALLCCLDVREEAGDPPVAQAPGRTVAGVRSLVGRDQPPPENGLQGAGSVHHIAWASPAEEHEAWQRRVKEAGAHGRERR